MKKSGTIILVLCLAVLAGAYLYLFSYPAPYVDPEWELPAATEIPRGAVTVRFSGTSTLLFSDGDTDWMIDGWFTRPGPLAMLLGDVEPDLESIDYGLAQNEVTELAAVIPMHSHYDHAMDSPEVARRTGAMLIGSEASANIARGWGLPEGQIRVVADGEEVALGDFRVRFIESRHFLYPDEGMVETLLTQREIPAPLTPPASIYDYKLGKAYVLDVRHPSGSFMVVGSAGFIPGLLQGSDVDVLFLGVGGLGSQRLEYREKYWRHTVTAVNPERIIPIHWDSLTGPVQGPLTGEVRIAGLFMSGEAETLAFLQQQERLKPEVPFQTLPRFEPVLLFR